MLSILIPAYNHENYIEDAIANVMRIDVPGKRVFVIDDASTDNTARKIESFLSKTDSSQITYIRKTVNQGLVHSINLFLQACETEFIYMIASDDLAIPEGISALVSKMRQRPNLQFIIGGGFNIFEDGRRTPLYGPGYTKLFKQRPEQISESLFLYNYSPLLLQSSIFRLSAIRDVGGFDSDIVSDDYLIFAKLFVYPDRRPQDYCFLPDIPCVNYRHHGANSYQKIQRQAITTIQVIKLVAPERLRAKAINYKISFFALMSLRRLQIRNVFAILSMARVNEAPWLLIGLVANVYHWVTSRV